MPETVTPSSRITRRTLLKAGIAGGAALAMLRWLYMSDGQSATPSANPTSLDASAREILAAIVPELLKGAIPPEDAFGASAEVLAGVERAIAGLPPATRKELDELFSLLAFAPTRCLVAGVWSSWPKASPDAIAEFLDRWRDSGFALLRSAYGALHQLVLAAWYGNPRSWSAIGYPGPPSLEFGA
ncbi:MAG: hypothetical protein E6H74_05990 [Betaproteobacteria bacterium]|nr:MAG: hypothetical protein E6H74_05990 [Betaproteobacteria bacterium]